MGDKFRALLSMCKDEGIEISYQPLDQKNGLLGLYFRAQDGTPIIILDKHLERNPRVERCVLSEEVFHHFTGVTYSIFNPHRCYGTAVLSQKNEHVAKRRSSEFLMPTPDFREAIRRGRRTIHDLIEYFYVVEWMFWTKINCLRQDVLKKFSLRVSAKEILTSSLLIDNLWGWDENVLF